MRVSICKGMLWQWKAPATAYTLRHTQEKVSHLEFLCSRIRNRFSVLADDFEKYMHLHPSQFCVCGYTKYSMGVKRCNVMCIVIQLFFFRSNFLYDIILVGLLCTCHSESQFHWRKLILAKPMCKRPSLEVHL